MARRRKDMQVQTVAREHRPIQAQRRGRPPKPDEQKLSEILNFRATKQEADAVYAFAIRHGKPLNVVLRAMLQRLLSVSK